VTTFAAYVGRVSLVLANSHMTFTRIINETFTFPRVKLDALSNLCTLGWYVALIQTIWVQLLYGLPALLSLLLLPANWYDLPLRGDHPSLLVVLQSGTMLMQLSTLVSHFYKLCTLNGGTSETFVNLWLTTTFPCNTALLVGTTMFWPVYSTIWIVRSQPCLFHSA